MNTQPSFVLRFAYIIFLGILITSFIGFGIAAFYKAPQMPSYRTAIPEKSLINNETGSTSAQQNIEQTRYDQEWNTYQEASKEYNRNVSLIGLVASIFILIAGVILAQKLTILADGIMLGSVLTLIYSIIRGFESQDTMFRFIIISVSLFIAVVLGFIKFIRPQSSKTK